MKTSSIRALLFAIAVACIVPLTGCQSAFEPDLTPPSEVLNASCCDPDTSVQINFLSLRRTPVQDYILDTGDTLGIYIQGITGDKDQPPPVNFPEDASQQPGLGYPVPIRDDGFISLPLVPPIRVEGLTLAQAEAKIQQAYTKDKKILLEGNEKIIVTLMRRRTYNVLVVREDVSDNRAMGFRNNDFFVDEGQQGQTFSLDLPAYKNDVMHALSETGGMPGEGALNEIMILRGGMNSDPNAIIQTVGGELPMGSTLGEASVVRIPVRGEPHEFPQLTDQDITLNDGDVVYIKGRERDVFYTGGLLEGGRFPLPRDYQVDVLEAISMAGGSAQSSSGLRGVTVAPPTQVTILRKCGCEQVAIDVDLRYALGDPTERVIVQPGDLIILEYRKRERFINSVVSLFQFGGITNLLR